MKMIKVRKFMNNYAYKTKLYNLMLYSRPEFNY